MDVSGFDARSSYIASENDCQSFIKFGCRQILFRAVVLSLNFSRICGFKPTTAEDMIADYGVAKAATPTAMQPVMHQVSSLREEMLVTGALHSLLGLFGFSLRHYKV